MEEMPFHNSGQTAVSECRGPVVTVVIKRPELCNAANKEAAKCLLEELRAF
ncbi:putative enoyl-CoA hydratase mitochondrial [Scophthalmus maximus]|uniref:Putative enoyl-CoA hydratase mitochondrial n=1 Tax=Scophthalmus maximus TaxID=52904 RepID=A0A2U9CXF9_SCOMX|nr:putative enoyl-CoA hydratase mitochondrial [Scophthalmus maximus]